MEECCKENTECCAEKTECCKEVSAEQVNAAVGAEFDTTKAICELSVNLVKLQTNVNEIASAFGKHMDAMAKFISEELTKLHQRVDAATGVSSEQPEQTNQMVNGEESAPVI
jgi:hypothetical protein